MSYDYRTPEGDPDPLHDGPLTFKEIDQIVLMDEVPLCEVFRVPLSPLMENDYDESCDWMIDECVLGGAPYELEDWSYTVVGCEEGNILHMLVSGWIVPFD